MLRQALLSVLLGALGVAPALAEQVPKRPDDAVLVIPPIDQSGDVDCPAGNRLIPRLLAVVINDLPYDVPIAAYQRPCGALIVAASELEYFSIKTAGRPTVEIDRQAHVNLNAFPGLTYTLDTSRQVLYLEGKPEIFYPSVVDLRPRPELPEASANWGGTLNYGVFARNNTVIDQASYDGFASLTAFGKPGYLVSNWVGSHSDGRTNVLRLNTAAVRDMPRRLATLRVGDVFSVAGEWGSRLSLGGVQYGTNFATQPYFGIAPTELFETAIDRAASVRVDADVLGASSHARTQRARFLGGAGQVRHGPVRLVNLPVLRNGRYEVVLRDSLDREFRVKQRYFFSRGLLRQGVHDFDYAVGLFRQSIFNNDYADIGASINHRLGLTRWWTGEVHVEASEAVTAAGLSSGFAVPWLGVLELSAANSWPDDGGRAGQLGIVGLENRYDRLGYALRHQCNDREFLRVGGPAPSRCSSFASISGRVTRRHSMTAAASRLQPFDGPSTRRVSVNLLGAAPRFALTYTFGLRANVDTWDDWQADLGLSLSFSRLRRRQRGLLGFRNSRLRVDASGDRNDVNRARATVSSNRRFGARNLSVAYSSSLLDDNSHSLSASWTGQRVNVVTNVTRNADVTAYSAGATSGLVWMGGTLLPTRPLFGSFGLARVGKDYAGVRVNGFRTNRNGDVIVSPLQPYLDNPISLDANDLPLNARADTLEKQVVPRARSGVIARFELQQTQDAIVLLEWQGDDGRRQTVRTGAFVSADGEASASVVGSSGQTYVTNVSEGTLLQVFWDDQRCSARVAGLPPRPEVGVLDDDIPEIGPLRCE